MQERRVNMRGGRMRPSVPEPLPVDDSVNWSAGEPVSEPLSRSQASVRPPQPPETYVERVWNLAKRTVTDLLGMTPSEEPLVQRRMEGESGPRSAAWQNVREDSVTYTGATASDAPTVASTNAAPYTYSSPAAANANPPSQPNLNSTANPAVTAPAPNITMYQFYAAPHTPSLYPPVSGQTVLNGRGSVEADLFVPRVSLLSRPVLTYAGQKRARAQDRPLNTLRAAPLGQQPPPAVTEPIRHVTAEPVAPVAPAAVKPLPLDVSTNSVPGKPTFAFGQAAPATAKPADSGAALPFARVTSSAPASSTAPKVNSFFNSGPPAEIPTEDGFASNADSSDDEAPSKPEPPKPVFTFGAPPSASTGFGAAPASTSAAPSNPFSLGSKPSAAPSTSAPASTSATAAKPATNSFFRTGPPVEIPTEDGFASNADSGEEDNGKDEKKTQEPVKPAFTFGMPTKPNFGSTPAAPAPASSTAPKVNSFFNSGPTAEIPTEDGFASNADSSDDEAPSKPEPPKPVFTFGAPPSASTGFGAAPASTSAAPSNPFSLGSKPSAAPSTSAPASTSATAAKPATNSFFRTGPPVEIPTEDGFASNADSGEEDNGRPDTGKPTATDTPAKPFLSFGLTSSTPPSAGTTANGPLNAASPFSFGSASSSTSVKPAFGSGSSAPSWGLPSAGSASATEKKDADTKPAAPAFSFTMGSTTNVKPAFS